MITRALLLCYLALAATILACFPFFPERVSLEADFVAKDGRGDYAEFAGRARVVGRRSAFSEAFGTPLAEGAPQALRKALISSIAQAPAHASEADRAAWRRQTAIECERAMAERLGGRWSAELDQNFSLAPSGPPDPDSL